MVNFPLPKYITAARRDAATGTPKWSNASLARDAPAPRTATCLRCAVSIASDGEKCSKPALRRCEHCEKGHRAKCELVPNDFNARVDRLYVMRDTYEAAVAAVPGNNAAAKRADAAVQAAGLKLARFQKLFNQELEVRRRRAARSGIPLTQPTHTPTTTPEFLALILGEQRGQSAVAAHAAVAADRLAAAAERSAAAAEKQAKALEGLLALRRADAETLIDTTGGNDDDDDDDDPDGIESSSESESSDDDDPDDPMEG
ncbi:hypothetical protein MBLNU459_g0794t1 [Dothideomycetes sp. NU459]